MAEVNIQDAEGSELTGSEVEEWVNELEMDEGLTAMRLQMEERHRDLVAMQDRPALAEHLLRAGIVVSMNSPLLGDLANQVIADIRPFSTDITAVPMEQGVEDDCDELERWLAVYKATANPGWKHSQDFLWHLFLSNYAVAIFRANHDVKVGPNGDKQWVDFPFEWLIPDPSTCFFHIEGAPFIPAVLARKYEQSVRSVEQSYKGAPPFANSMPLYKDGNLQIVSVGDDYKLGTSGKYNGNAKRGEMVTMYELYTPTQQYIYVMDKTGNPRAKQDLTPRSGPKGKLIYWGDNLTGGVPAVIGSGMTQPIRTIPKERLQPAFRALYQDVKNLNRAWATIATMAENSKPELINQKGPETLKAEARYTGKPTQQLVNDGTGPAIVDIAGDRMMQWEHQEDKNILEIANHWDNKTTQDSQRWRQLADPEILKDIKANVYLTSAESTHRSLSGVLTNYDFMLTAMCSFGEKAANGLKRKFPLYSAQDVVYGRAKKGSGSNKVGKGELVELDGNKEFKHTLIVTTRSMSEAEQRMRREDMNARRAAGSATFMQELEIDYDDTQQQLEDLAIDRMLEHSEITFGAAKVDLAVQDAIRLIGGVYIPLAPGAGAPIPAVNQPAPAGNSGPPPTGQAPMRPAVIGGASGGSQG